MESINPVNIILLTCTVLERRQVVYSKPEQIKPELIKWLDYNKKKFVVF